jgi:two-component system, OmpR family, response regulator
MGEVDKTWVLVVDDEETITSSLQEFLADAGFSVETAASAEEGLELLEHREFQVAVVDLRLPGRSGDSFISEAAKEARWMSFLIHTGSMDYRISDELKSLGITQEQVLLKPLPDLNVLVIAIERLVAR